MSYCEDYPQMSCVERPLKKVSQPFLGMRKGKVSIKYPGPTARLPVFHEGQTAPGAEDRIRRRGAKQGACPTYYRCSARALSRGRVECSL